MKAYRQRTGIPWVSHYGPDGPRGRTEHHIWQTEHLGQVHRISSSATYWRKGESESPVAKKERSGSSDDRLELELRVVSSKPKVLLINDLLNEDEADLLRELGIAKAGLSDSTLGGDAASAFKDTTRTSRTGWLRRDVHSVVNNVLFPRFADVLKIDDMRLHHGNNGSAENLQVVHYDEGQEYQHHVDFFTTGNGHTRYATLLTYLSDAPSNLSDPTAGGTSFPRAFDGRGLKIRPPKGSAVLFYSLHEDGNGDPLSEHAGLPVPSGYGQKWVTNLWVWDPHKN